MGFRPDFTNLEHGNTKLPDPFNGPNSENILNDLANNKLDSISNITATSKDRQAISNYLNTFMRYHFDDIESLKSLSVLKQIL